MKILTHTKSHGYCRLFTVPNFFFDRRDIARLTVNGGHLDFQMKRGGGRWGLWLQGEGGREKQRVPLFFKLPPKPSPLPKSGTHARWQPVTQSARSRRSYGKIEDCEQSMALAHTKFLSCKCCTVSYRPYLSQSMSKAVKSLLHASFLKLAGLLFNSTWKHGQ